MQQNYESKPVATNQSKVSRKALVFLLISVFFDLLSIGILIPVIPYVVGQFNKDALIIGLLAVSFSAAQFFAASALGILSDRYGRRPLLLISVAGTALGYFIFGFANALWMIYPAMTLVAVGGGMAEPTLTSTISNRVSPSQQGSILGASQALESMALILGPIWAGLTFDYLGANIPYWTGAGWLAIAALLASSIL